MANKKILILIFAGAFFLMIGFSGMITALTQISTCQQLQNMKNSLSGDYVLINNIDCNIAPFNAGQGFEPIGTLNNPFTGTFDGNSFNIDGLYINRQISFVGLFGKISGSTISNVILNDVDISGFGGVGALAGESLNSQISNSYSTGNIKHVGTSTGNCGGGLVGRNTKGSISDSYSSVDVIGFYEFIGGLVCINNGPIFNSYSTGSVSGSQYVGGLVGYNSQANISNSYSTGSVSGSNSVGGLSGNNYQGNISNSYSTGSVSGSQHNAGGLIGYNERGDILNSYSTGSVSGSQYVGGLVGQNYLNSKISNSYSTGSVSGSQYVGGLFGYHFNGEILNSYSTGSVNGSQWVGGLLGYNSGTVSNSYSTGSVSGSQYVGGLVGDVYTVSSCTDNFWDTQTSGTTTSGITFTCGLGKTTAQMKQQSTFTNWDFTNIWAIKNGYSYSCLKWQPNCPPVSCIDNDGDGYGVCPNCGTSMACTYNGNDCNDNNLTIKPSQTESCDGVDNNCDSAIDNNACSSGKNCIEVPPYNCVKETSWAFDDTLGGYYEINSETVNAGTLIHPVFSNSIISLYPGVENFDSNTWYFEIYEKDSGFCAFGVGDGCDDKIRTSDLGNKLNIDSKISASQIIANWTIIQSDIDKAETDDSDSVYEFYFVLHGVYGFGAYTWESPILQLNWPTAPSCSDGIQNQQEIGTDCGGPNCSPCPPAQCSNGVQDSGETDIDCGGPCLACPGAPDFCSQNQFCSAYIDAESCAQNTCGFGPQNIECAGSISCGCSWNSATNLCNSYYTDDSGGTCIFSETEIQNCEDKGFLEYSILASWSPITISQPEDCKDGTFGPIACAAQTRLPLESGFGILLTIILITGIYFIFLRR